MRLLFRLILATSLLALSGCFAVYKTEIQQGNVITQEMVDKLKPGMTKSQVRFVLGTPLITDPFHPERWDYIYLYKKNVTAPAETRPFAVFFDGDVLTRVEGDMTMNPNATATDKPADATVSSQPTEPMTPPRSL